MSGDEARVCMDTSDDILCTRALFIAYTYYFIGPEVAFYAIHSTEKAIPCVI